MGRQRSRTWGKNKTAGNPRGRHARAVSTRRLRLEALEDRRLLTFGSELELDGVDDYATAADSTTLDLGVGASDDLTIEARFRVGDMADEGRQTLIHKEGAYSLAVVFHGSQPDQLAFQIWQEALPGGSMTLLATPSHLTAGWHHVAAVFDNGYSASRDFAAIFLDGVRVGLTTDIALTPGIANSPSSLQIGSRAGAEPFHGCIDEVRLSRIVRYRNTYNVSADPFVTDTYTQALWHFDESAGAGEFADASGNGNTLAAVNGARTDVPPTVPSVPDLADASDTGVSNWDNLTNLDNSVPDKSLQFLVGNTVAGATVTLLADGVVVGNAVADGDMTTVTTNGSLDLADGTHRLSARQTLPARPESLESAALNVTVDTVAPTTPTAPDLQPNSDTGVSTTDNVTGDNTPTFDLTVPAGFYFRMYRDGVQISGDSESGATYTTPVQPDGIQDYTVAAVDAAGNVSAASLALSVTIDASIPDAPDLLAVSDTGLSSTDKLTNLDNSQPDKVLQFSVGNTIAGATVTLYADGTPIGSAVADDSTTTVTTNGSTTLASGMHRIAARQTMPGQAESRESASLQILVDVSPFTGPLALDLQPASDTGISNTDNITSDNTPTFDLGVPDGFYSRVFRDGAVISGDWETGTHYTTAVQADGTYKYSYALVDAAGNVSAMSPALSVTIDSTIPSAPDLLAASDSGIYDYDNVTNLDNSRPDRTLQFTVGNTIAGATVTLYADGTAIGSAVADGTITTVTTNGTVDLSEGSHTITARATVPGRAESTDSAALNVSVDTAACDWGFHEVGWYQSHATVLGVVVSGTEAYVVEGGGGLHVLDVSNPAQPTGLVHYDTPGNAREVALSGVLALVADDDEGLQIIDVTDPAAPVRLGGYDTSGYAYSVAVSGTLAYVADYQGGLQIIDFSNPAAPVRIGSYDTSGYAQSVAISGTLAYVAEVGAGLEIIDVSDPAAPVRLGGYDTPGYAMDVAVWETLAYVADHEAGFVILDVSNPAAPVRIGGRDTSGTAVAVAVSETTVYVADGAAGLQVYDASNPVVPGRLGGFDPSGSMSGVTVCGTRAYLATGTGRLQIIDIGEPALPLTMDLRATSDTGLSTTDNVTADNTPTFDLINLGGLYSRIYRDGIQISGDWETGAYYTTAVQPDGSYNYSVVAVDKAGNVSPQSPPLSVTIDTRPPVVANVLAGGTSWTGSLAGGYSIPVGSGRQLAPLPLANINQIKVVLNEDASVDEADLILSGVNTTTYDLSGAAFSYDPGTFTATWTLASPLAADKLQIRLNADSFGLIKDPAGNRLDGEWTNPATPADTGTDTYPSGNGTAGGDFVFLFRVLPGDVNQDGAVDIFDVAKLQLNYGADHGMMPADGDLDGNGTVDIFDVAILQREYGRALDSPAPAPAAAPSAETESALPLVTPRSPANHLTQSPKSTVAFPLAPARARTFSGEFRKLARSCGATVAGPLAKSLAVHHSAADASWQAAVDRLLDAGEDDA